MEIISNLLKPADDKSLYRQIINQLNEDFIKQVDEHYELDEDENDSFIVRSSLENAINNKIRNIGYGYFEDIDC